MSGIQLNTSIKRFDKTHNNGRDGLQLFEGASRIPKAGASFQFLDWVYRTAIPKDRHLRELVDHYASGL